MRFLQRGGCAGALHAPLGQPVEQQQQETPRAHGTYTHQDELPQAGPVTPHLLHRQTLAFTCLAVLNSLLNIQDGHKNQESHAPSRPPGPGL